MSLLKRVTQLNYKIHLFVSLCVRLILVAYGIYHDQISRVQYSDIDYKVFTDAAKLVLTNGSPYDRHTFRYSPLVAYFVIPNIVLHPCFGKLLFCLFDLLDGILIKFIIKTVHFEYLEYTKKQNVPQITSRLKRLKSKRDKHVDESDVISNIGLISWLYNPLTLAISTRGNCDSIAVFLVLATLYTLQCKKCYFFAGLLHGISIHFRLYPIIYSLTFYMHLSRFSFYSLEDRKTNVQQCTNMKALTTQQTEKRTIFQKKYLLYLIPNLNQLKLIEGCIIALFSLNALFYYLYGYKFLHETYIYHFIRRDTRHNFSLYFYLLYLTAWIKNIGLWQRVLIVLPQVVLLLVFSFRYGLNRFALNFSILVQTIVFVAYNTVLTSQYFVWIMAVLPLCLWQIRMSKINALLLLVIWFAAQAAWLLPAYLLEFHGQSTFFFIWIQSVSFFCANIAILGRLIKYFMPTKKDV